MHIPRYGSASTYMNIMNWLGLLLTDNLSYIFYNQFICQMIGTK